MTLLLRQVKQQPDGDERRFAFEGLTLALAGHLRALDQVVIPTLQPTARGNALQPTVDSATAVSRMLAELVLLDPTSDPFRELFELLGRGTLQLFERERDTLLTLVHRLQSAAVEQQLAATLELHLDRSMAPDAARERAADAGEP